MTPTSFADDFPFAHSVLHHPTALGMAMLDRDARMLAWNDRARELLTPERCAVLEPVLREAMSQLLLHPERTIVHVHGTEGSELECRLRAVRRSEGPVLGFTCSLLAPAEAAGLAESADRARWRFALENAQDGLWDWSAETGRVYRSSRCLTMLGHPPDAVADTVESWRELIHPDDRGPVAAALQAHLAGDRDLYQVEYRARAADGEWRWILDRGRVIAWRPDGRPARVIGTHTDITSYKRIEATLRERDILLEEAQRVGRVGSWAVDVDTGAVWWSPEQYRIFGWDPSLPPPAISGLRQFFEPETHALIVEKVDHAMRTGTRYAQAGELRRPDGEVRLIEASGEPIRDATGRIVRLVGVVHDITEDVAAEEQTRRQNDLLARIASMGRIGGFEILPGGDVAWTEENYEIHGIAPGTPITLPILLRDYDEPSRRAMLEMLDRMYGGELGEGTVDATFQRPDGERVRLRMTASVERRGGGAYRITGLTRDITQEHAAAERIEQLAHYDTLTGLPNRFLFRQRAEDAITQTRHGEPPLALLFLDLDRFKNVNDTQGHQAGDRLLQEVARRLRTCVRASDLVGRLGGDEFLVLLRDIGRPEDAAVVARKIIAVLAEPVVVDGTEARIGCSIGIALLGESAADLDALLRAADTAMYAAKDAGRNTFEFYDDSFYRRVQRRVTLEQELRQAVPRGELCLLYQPTMRIGDGGVSGLEALVRWRGPDGDWRSPVEFIPIAEDSGEILTIGRWVLAEACRQAREWHEAGLQFGRIAVNVSAVQLRDPKFAEDVLAICAQAQWPTDRLELELTESALMRDSDVLRRAFDLFSANAITLAVDDFGTGFSNLGYLHRFPVRHLKIDRGFVQQMHDGARMRGLTQAVVTLGHALGMAVVAEGVEDERTLDLLREQGCDEAQGYLFTRPLPPAEMAEWLRGQADAG